MWELRSHMPCGAAKLKQSKTKQSHVPPWWNAQRANSGLLWHVAWADLHCGLVQGTQFGGIYSFHSTSCPGSIFPFLALLISPFCPFKTMKPVLELPRKNLFPSLLTLGRKWKKKNKKTKIVISNKEVKIYLLAHCSQACHMGSPVMWL